MGVSRGMVALATLLLAVMVALAPAPARAALSIYTVGYEDMDARCFGTYSVNTTGGQFLGSMRSGMKVTASGVNGGYCAWDMGANRTDFWVGFYVYNTGSPNPCCSTALHQWIRLLDAQGVVRAYIQTQSGASTIYPVASGAPVYKVTAAGAATLIGNFNCAIAMNALTKIDIHVANYTNASTGKFEIFANGAMCLSFTGNVQTDSASGLAIVQVGSATPYDSVTTTVSSLVALSDDTRTIYGQVQVPNGTGNSNTWTCTGATPSASINTAANTDATNCNSTTPGQLQQFTVPAISGSGSILAYAVAHRSDKGSSGPANIKPCVRIGGTDSCGSDDPQSISLGISRQWMLADPVSLGPWSPNTVNAAGFNIGLQSAN